MPSVVHATESATTRACEGARYGCFDDGVHECNGEGGPVGQSCMLLSRRKAIVGKRSLLLGALFAIYAKDYAHKESTRN